MYHTKKDNILIDESQEIKWLKTAFIVSIFAIFCSFTIPNLVFLIFKIIDYSPDSFIRIILGTIPVQLSLLIPIVIMMLYTYKNYNKKEIYFKGFIKKRIKLVRWQNSYIITIIKLEFILFIPLCLLAYLSYKLVIYFGFNPSSPLTVLLSIADIKGIILIFFLSVFIAPITEEIIFRRIIFSFLRSVSGSISSAIVTSLLFSALHGGLIQILPLTILGCVLQFLYIRTKSLYPCIIMHSFHNFIMMLLLITAWLSLGIK